MKISYREKIVLLVVIIFLVVLIFVMWPIKTIRKNIDSHQKEYDEVKIVYDENKRLIAEIPTIEGNISKIYEASKDINKNFIAHKENFEIDKYLQEFVNNEEYMEADKNKFEITGVFKQEDTEASPLDFYYYTPTIITYPILENADVNGNLLSTTDNALYKKAINAMVMNQLEPQAIEKHVASVEVKFTKEALFTFLDGLKKKDTGLRVTSVIIDNYTFNETDLEKISVNPLLARMIGFSSGTIEFEFYTMQEIQKPVLD